MSKFAATWQTMGRYVEEFWNTESRKRKCGNRWVRLLLLHLVIWENIGNGWIVTPKRFSESRICKVHTHDEINKRNIIPAEEKKR